MTSDPAVLDRRVLLLAPTARDGVATQEILSGAGIACAIFATLERLCAEVPHGAAAVIVPEETLIADGANELARCLGQQEVWSDLPVLVLARAGVESSAISTAMATIGNLTLIERPMRVSTLLSSVRTALRARTRQYEMRGHLAERKRTEERLARDALLLSEVQDAVIVTDLAGVVTFWNAGATRLLGWTAAEMMGRPLRDRISSGGASNAVQRFIDVANGQPEFEGDVADHRKDGTVVWTQTSIRRVSDGAGRPIGVMGVSHDVSERKRAEHAIAQRAEERQHLYEMERAARSEAEQASRMKDEFLATLSHELRTPLSAILGWSQILRRKSPDVDVLAEGLTTIERNARVQTQIIDDLLDMSRIISGKVVVDAHRTDLTAIVRAAIETVRPTAALKKIEVIFDEGSPRSRPIVGDVNRLQQVFWNLLSNAIKFTPGGGKVRVRIGVRDDCWDVEVIDSGEGIRAEFVPHVFERFRQADASTTRRHGGLGLGLAIVKQLVEAHGGEVSVRSDGPGTGATFTVSLLIAEPERANPRDRAPVDGDGHAPAAEPTAARVDGTWHDPPHASDLRDVVVLVVDDEPDARALLKHLLEDRGAKVVLASSADEALVAVRRDRPTVLVSDIGMPSQDGYALLDRVRQLGSDEGGLVPAIALTAFARAEDRSRAVRAGFQMHLPKPVEPGELFAKIARLATLSRLDAAQPG